MEWRVGDELRIRRLGSGDEWGIPRPLTYQERVVIQVGPVHITIRPMWVNVGVINWEDGRGIRRVMRRRHRPGVDQPRIERVLRSQLNSWYDEGYVELTPGAGDTEELVVSSD